MCCLPCILLIVFREFLNLKNQTMKQNEFWLYNVHIFLFIFKMMVHSFSFASLTSFSNATNTKFFLSFIDYFEMGIHLIICRIRWPVLSCLNRLIIFMQNSCNSSKQTKCTVFGKCFPKWELKICWSTSGISNASISFPPWDLVINLNVRKSKWCVERWYYRWF